MSTPPCQSKSTHERPLDVAIKQLLKVQEPDILLTILTSQLFRGKSPSRLLEPSWSNIYSICHLLENNRKQSFLATLFCNSSHLSEEMAACIDKYSRNPSTSLFCDDSCYKFRLNDSRFKIIRLCRPNGAIKDSSRHTPHECDEDQTIWQTIREEAQRDREQEPILAGHYDATILSHKSLENAIAANLAFKLCNPSLSSEVLYEVFIRALKEDNEIRGAIRSDLKAWKERDPACLSYVHCFLNFKGFQAIQAQRAAHKFWMQGRTVLAALIQSRVSEVFAVDIHPGAKIGWGIVLDHATGVVIGETAVIGNGVTILHNVTLGGTGKVAGDRHPKVEDGVLIGAGAKVLGNIRIGEGAKIGAGSVVLKDVSPRDTVVGNPAKSVRSRERQLRT